MKTQYYNTLEFNKIVKIMNTNPKEAKNNFEDYLKKYPRDYSAYLWYIETLICLGEFKNAEKIFKYIENKINSSNINLDRNKINIFNKHKFYIKLKLLSYQEKYEDLYTYCVNNINRINELGLNHLLFWCKKHIGKIDPNRRDNNLYLFRQIVEYKESDLLDNLKKHEADCYEENKDTKGIFSPEFPLEEVLKEIKKYIPSKNRIYPRLFENDYVFKYNECGRENNKLVNYFKVICLHNTDNIITAYPSNDCEHLPCIDLNYLKKEEQPKIKKISQIDKFNLKYKRS